MVPALSRRRIKRRLSQIVAEWLTRAHQRIVISRSLLPPIIATSLFATFHSSFPIAIYIALMAVVGIISTALLTDHTGKDISAEYAGV